MASHLFSRPSSAKFALRKRLRRVLLESLERREMMAVDVLGLSDFGAPVSYSLAGQSSQPLAFQSTGDLSSMSPDDVTNYLDTTFSSTRGPLNSREWFPLIQESYSKWSEQNGLAFSYASGLNAAEGLVAEGEPGGPRLLSVAPNSGNIFSFNNVNTITEAPTELVFRFDGSTGVKQSTIANGIKLIRAGRDGGFTEGNEQIIAPGFLNFGESDKVIVMRFASTLPDDLYRVVVVGEDNALLGETAIRAALPATGLSPTLQTRTIDSTRSDLTRDTVDFKLELGALVTAVVPQPVDRVASNSVTLLQSAAAFTLTAHQGDLSNNTAGTSVSLRFVASALTVSSAAYDLPTNRITVNVGVNATVDQVVAAIANGTGIPGNFSVAATGGGSNLFNANDLGTRTVVLNNWALDVKQNQIRVYFNDDDLNLALAEDPKFYQLVRSTDSISPNDDFREIPQSVSYDSKKDVATLTFANSLHMLAGNGTFRLRVGSGDFVPSAANPSVVTSVFPADAGSSSATANTSAIPTLGATPASFNIRGSIVTQTPLLLDYPGSNNEPGHRDITTSEESHLAAGADSNDRISVIQYNFGERSDGTRVSYGNNAAGQPLFSSITPEQKQRVRDIFEFYSSYLGVDVVETETSGFRIVVGDMYPLLQGAPKFGSGIAGGNLAIMDGALVWDNSLGGSFFGVTIHEVGHLLGLGHDSELPIGTDMRGTGAGSPLDPVFPGNQDVVHGQHLYRPDSRDVDMYQFEITNNSGTVRIETIAERLANSSNLDSYLTLFKKDPATGALTVISTNNDYFSSDSFIEARLEPGLYVVGVTASGNQDYNPVKDETGSGGVSDGDYQLRFDFSPDNQSTIVDLSGTALDGNGDGQAGGDFNFWFQAAAPIPSNGVPNSGSKTIYVVKGATGARNGSPAHPFADLPSATASAAPGDIIRVVGSLGADGRLSERSDNPAYEIGRGGVGNSVLSDGVTLEVPQGVTLMVDAGAIFKVGGSRIVAGSRDASIDRRFSSIQVLGTPKSSVFFTSYNDQSIGVDTNPLNTTPQPGDWGGIELHNDIDRNEGRGDWERKGIFLNYIAHANLKYGGGPIVVTSPSLVTNPVDLREARPTLLYNSISLSADSAISADPNSFEETRFTHPSEQLTGVYRPDYVRVGPDIRGSSLTNNSINGLFIRVPTLPGSSLQTLNVQARLDDTDVTYFLGGNLIITGTPGGAFRESIAPDVSLIQFPIPTTTALGTLVPAAVYNYKVTFIDRNGGEGIQSAATLGATASANGVIVINNLPAARGEFVSRRLWRSSTGANGQYELIAELDRESLSYTDLGSSTGAVLPAFSAALNRARTDARLAIDPGVILKLANSRIEVGLGAQLIAEGTPDHPIIFTSRFDDTYGAGGTFDTTNDGSATTPAAGNWGGIIARQLSSLSIDSARIAFGGGGTSIPGGVVGFNAVEVHQANARIANSTFERNASGISSDPLEQTRDGRGNHDESVIFARGAQPVIVNNIIRNNATPGRNAAAISIDANSMKAISVQDQGRETGANGRFAGGLGNYGPLVSGNRLLNDDLNGMRIRGATLTTESVWDDSDIVHVLQSEIFVPNFHTYGGLLLKSQSDESLVVKLGRPTPTTTVGFTATGTPLEITDRIGGAVQVIGAPGFPVILTSLRDDSVGAGFSSTGQALKDTNNDGSATTATAGDWRGILLDQHSNDRNVDTIIELEPDQIQEVGINDLPTAAQSLGGLSNSLQAGDENLRLGFTARGVLASPEDLDVYSFVANAGTQVWIDIDRTDMSLDSVVELIDAEGRIIAQSDNSLTESGNLQVAFVDPARIIPSRVQPMDSNPFAPQNSRQPIDADFHSINPKDAGLRVQLPGASGFPNTYYIRVRSSNIGAGQSAARLQDPNLLRAGISEGSYQLQVRLQQQDEIAGSAIRYADVRFATNGVQIVGLPSHSPLLGTASAVQGAGPGSSTNLGNLASSDRGAFSLAGEINSQADVDYYQFSLEKTLTQRAGDGHISVSIDVDYASDFGGPNTSLWLYRRVGNGLQLVLTGSDSNIADDRSAPGQGGDLDDLSRGSFGPLDAYIGTQELPRGEYVLAVTNNSLISRELEQFQLASPFNAAARLQPLTSVARLTADRFNPGVVDPPETAGGAPGSAGISAVPWTLGDVTSFALQSDGTILLVNPLTGAQIASNDAPIGGTIGDVAISPDGRLVTFRRTAANDFDSAAFLSADTKNNLNFAGAGNAGIQTFTTINVNNVLSIVQQDVGFTFSALTFFNQASTNPLALFGVGSRNAAAFRVAPLDGNGNIIQPGPGPDGTAGTPDDIPDLSFPNFSNIENILWKLDPGNGAAINPDGFSDRTGNFRTQGTGTQKVAFGQFISSGTITGITSIGSNIFAVSDTGQFFVGNLVDGTIPMGSVSSSRTITDPTTGAAIQFTGLTSGRAGIFPNTLFGTTANGTIYAIGTNGTLQPIFPGAVSFVRSNSLAPSSVVGMDLSPLVTNLWHTTTTRGDEFGHGIDIPVDDSQTARQAGGTSFYFGYEADGTNWPGNYNVAAYSNRYNLPGGAHGAIESNPIDLSGISSADLPTLYFNYHLATEGAAGSADAFRVYGVGDDGVWRILVTNNSADDGDYGNGGEIDQGVSRNVDPYRTPLSVQEAFDTGSWRQARVNLAAFAGQKVRLRFEFSTAGSFYTNEPRFGGVELTAVAGSRIDDGDTFQITTADRAPADFRTARFEFDLGLVLDLPSGASIQNGVSALNINGTTLTFSIGAGGPGLIGYDPADTAAQIATKVRNALLTQFGAGVTVAVNSESLNVLNASGSSLPSFATYSVTGLPSAVIAGRPGVTSPNVAVPVTQAMTATQVRDRVRTALAATFNAPGQANNVGVWQVYGDTIRMFRYTASSPNGPMQVADRTNGDGFGTAIGSTRPAFNNGFSGLFVDDVVIGLAERGELVLNAQIAPQDTPTPSSALFSNNGRREYQQNGFVNSSNLPLTQLEVGRYQAEIRLSAEYGNDDGGKRQFLNLGIPNPGEVPPRVFQSNDRLTQSLGLDFSPAAMIADGATFTLSDSLEELTFEFDVRQSSSDPGTSTPGNVAILVFANETAAQVATKVRNAINSTTVQAKLKLLASVDGEILNALGTDQRPSNSARVLLHGPAAITRTGGSSNIPAAGITVKRWGDETAQGEDLGDSNRLRDQGMVVISQSSFTSSSQFGVNVDAVRRVVPAHPTAINPRNSSIPGSAVHFPTVNTDKLAPGVVIASNVFDRNLSGGILLSGDTPQANDVSIPSTVARILNNTISGLRSNDVGIRANEGASPTIINNIIARTQTGIDRSGAASTTTVSANLYFDNAVNLSGGSQSFAIVSPTTPFVANTSGGFFYPKAGSLAIDSSLDTLAELASLTQVKSTIGLPPSPALAPDRDVFGQSPLDDPTASDTSGIGANVFKDRGAVERADLKRLQAIILQPQDNDSANLDVDRNTTFIQVNQGRYDFFSVLLIDGTGTGPDEATVLADAITLTENGRLLKPGSDYLFGYDGNSHTVRLTPLAGIWRSDSVYEITLNNAQGRQVSVGDGSRFSDGNTVRVNYTTSGIPAGLILELDSGTPAGTSTANAVRIPFTSMDSDYQIAARMVAAINDANLGLTAYLQGNGTFMVVGSTNVVLTNVVLSNVNSGAVKTIGAIQDRAGNPLDPNRANSLTQFTIIMPDVSLDFGDALGANIPTIKAPNSNAAPTVTNGDGARHALLPIDVPLLALGQFVDADADGVPSAAASSDNTDSSVSLGTLAGAVFGKTGSASVVLGRAAISDGMQFSILDGIAHPLASTLISTHSGNGATTTFVLTAAPVNALTARVTVDGTLQPLSAYSFVGASVVFAVAPPAGVNNISVLNAGVVFEFDTNSALSSPNVIPISITAGDTTDAAVAIKLANAINGAVANSTSNPSMLENLIAVPTGGGNVRLIANNGYVLDIPAATPSAALSRLPVGNVSIDLSGLNLTMPTPAAALAALDGQQFSVTDGSGNTVQFELNQINDSVTAGFVGIDFDFAASTTTTASIASAIAAAINGQVVARTLVLGETTVVGSTIFIKAEDDDGVVFKGVFNAASNVVVATVTATAPGMLDAWIDWNGDGDFNDSGEQIVVSQPVQAGANNYQLTTPINATIGFVNARFRLSTLGETLPSGVAIGGEVEDYLIEIVAGTPPIAVPESYTVNEDTTLQANDPRGLLTPDINDNGVLANDIDPDNDFLAVPQPRFVYDQNPSTPAIDPLVNVSNGTLTLNLDGTFTYRPNLDFNGTDSFTYFVVDQRLRSNVPTMVMITVVAQNDAPLAVSDTRSSVEDMAFVATGADLTSNDYAHFGMAPGINFSPNASNESGQVLSLIGASIISDMTTSFGGIAGLGVRIAAKPGQGIYGIRVNVMTSDLGVGTLPTVSVVGSTITVTLNSNAGSVSTVNNFISAINGNAAAAAMVNVSITSGVGTTAIGNVVPTYSPLVVPPSGGAFVVAGNQLTYTPPAHYNSNIGGPALLLVTIQDDGTAGPIANLTSTSTLTINIAAVNDRPEYDPWSNPREVATVEVPNDNVGALVTVPNFITGIIPGPVEAVDEATGPSLATPENQSVSFSPPPLVRALDPTLFAVQPAIEVVGTTGTLTFQLAQDVNRVTPFPQILVEVIAQDSGAVGGANNDLNQSLARTFTIVPTAVNDAPEFTISASTGSLEDQGVVTVTSFMTGIRKGPATALDEVTQTLSITIVADPTAFTASGYPTIDLATGELRYETAPHVNRHTGQNFNVSVTVSDDGGTALGGVDRTTKSFLIDVTELNDAPEYVMPSVTSAFVEDPNALPNAPTVVPGFVTSIMPGPSAAVDEGPLREDQVVSFVVTALDPTLFDPAFLPTISDTGTLTYRLRPDVNQMIPFPSILVRVVAVDTGLNDAGNAVPRNINNAVPRTFTILPDPINDAPEFNLNATASSNEDVGVVTVADFVTGAAPGPVTALDELASQTLTITVVALDPTAFTTAGQPQIVLGANGRGVLTYETNRDVNSLTGHDLRVRVTLRDNGGTANVGDVDTTIKTFSIVVAAINDAPSFTLPAVPSVTVDEDNESVTGATPTVLPLATNVVAGPATALDETTIPATRQTLAFETTSVTNAGLFVNQPVLLPNGDLTFTTRKDQNGQSVVVVRLRDSGADSSTGNGDVNVSAEQTFTINIRAINDAPEFTIQSTANSREDQGLVGIPNFATGLRAGPTTALDELGSQTFTVHVRALDPAAFSIQPAIAADGTLTFQTALDVNSTMTDRDLRVEVYLDDDGVAVPPPNVDVSDRKTFTIVTTAVNDAPVFTLPVAQVDVIEDVEQFTGVSPTTVPSFATNIAQAVGLLSTPPTATDELSQALTFEVLSVSAPELFSIQPTISSAGVLSFRTAQHKNGKAVVIVRLRDDGASSPAPNDNDSDRKTFTISIAPINDAPQFDVPNSFTVAEDAGLVSQNSFATNVRRGPLGSEDENSQEIRFTVTALDPTSFTVQPTIGVDGTLVFQTAPNVNIANADMRVQVQLADNGAASPAPNNNLSVVKTFTLNVTPVNDPPIPDAFGVSINEDESVTILAANVLVGDRPGPTADENNQLMSMTQIERTSANGGTVIPTFSGNQIVSFQYIPPLNLVGTDTFLYVVTDTGVPARSGTGTITISLLGVNDPPQFVKGNDQIAPEDSPLISLSNWATSILPGPPGAVDELNSQTVSFDVSADKPELFEVQPSVSSDGTLRFQPKANANGVAIVTAIAVDNGAIPAQSQPQVFTITITPVNDAPVFTAGPDLSIAEDSGPYSQAWATRIAPAAGLLLTPPTATDESSQVVDFTVVSDRPALFSVQPTIDVNGRLQFTPARDAFGTALLTVRAVDRGPSGALDQNTSAPHTLTITINPTNDAPVAVGDTLNTNENAVLTVPAPGLLANDTDADLPNDTVTAFAGIFLSSLGATVTINANGSITYDPSPVDAIQQLTTGQSVQDTFVYKVRDAAGAESTETTVTVNVAGVNDAPTARDDAYTVGVGQSQLLDVLINDSDVDSAIDSASINVTALPAFGTVLVNQTGVIQYTSGGGFRGVDTFRYTVRDTAGNISNEALVTVTVNNRPIANPDTAVTFKNQAIDINVLANDTDLDGTLNPATVQIVLTPSPSGTATVLSNGSIRFVPATDYSGLVTLSYVVSDDVGTVSNVANVDIRVQRSKWQNPRNALDVNVDTFISPIDALLIINRLNDPTFVRDLRRSNFVPPPFLDVNGDEIVSAIDALLVINFLNTTRGAAEGEGEANLSATTYAMMVTPQQMIATVGQQVVHELQSELNESLLSMPADSSARSSSNNLLDGWLDDEEEEMVEELFCSSKTKHEKVADAFDSYFGSIGPYL